MEEEDYREYMGLRVYRNGKIGRWTGKRWKEVNNATNTKINGKTYMQKRIVMAAFNPQFDISDPELHVLHIDHNKKNKAFENLRVQTLEEREAIWAEAELRGEVRSVISEMLFKIEGIKLDEIVTLPDGSKYRIIRCV